MSNVEKNVILAPYTTYKVGGSAKYFISIKSKQDLLLVYDWLSENDEDFFILGGGSNVLVSDAGVDGLVIRMENTKVEIEDDLMSCQAGLSLADAFRKAKVKNLSGLAWSFGIPQATIGGAVRGNAGAFGESMADIVAEVEVFNLKNGQFKIFTNKDCRFDYRESIFKKDKKYLIWSVKLKMKRVPAADLEIASSQSLQYRTEHHPKLPSAGSVFKNLEVDYIKKVNYNLAEKLRQDGVIKHDRLGSGYFIDLLGLKGKTIGGAKISLEHANFIVNTGKAKASDIQELIAFVKKQILLQFKLELEEEIQYLGFKNI